MAAIRLRSLVATTGGEPVALRISGLQVQTSPASAAKLRVFGIEVATGAAAPPPATDGNKSQLDPRDTITLTGVGGGTWRQVAGTAVTLGGSGASRSYKAPLTLAGDVLRFTYSLGGQDVTVEHVVTPATERVVIGGQEQVLYLMTTADIKAQ